MKVFRISGRDMYLFSQLIRKVSASMKVFRISGRDAFELVVLKWEHWCLNESLPHKRKRPVDFLNVTLLTAWPQ